MPPGPTGAALRERLRGRLELLSGAGVAGDDALFDPATLLLFYERRGFAAAWVDSGGPLPRAAALIRTLAAAESHGLRAQDYHHEAIAALQAQPHGAAVELVSRLCDLDLLCSDAFLIHGTHLVSGRVDPETFDPEWITERREIDLLAALEKAVREDRVSETLDGFLPVHPGYARLRAALARYRSLAAAGGWRPVPEGPTLKPGSDDARVQPLRRRLAVTGELAQGAEPAPAYDEVVEQAVRAFQLRHGLDVDGAVGAKTLAALNVPARERVRQIELNLERWRWLPRDPGERYLLVNVPDFGLRVTEAGATVLEMRVVVGKDYRRTPVFTDLMRYLVLNPAWEVPHSIAVQDKLPLIRKDPQYLAKQKMRVFQGWGANAREIDPSSIDWAHLDARSFPYRLRQDPGPLNALGRIKFMFPNRFNVYLHDTPTREHFVRAERNFSSGCIRVEHPLDLAVYLLQDDPKWTRAALVAALEQNVERTVNLPRPLPVHLMYWTAWADTSGTPQFRRDLYGRDRLLDAALRLPPPEPEGLDGLLPGDSLGVPVDANGAPVGFRADGPDS